MQITIKAIKEPVLKKIGKVARRFLLAPLVTTLSYGCSPDECYSHNETTILLNRPTNGAVAPIKEIHSYPPQGELISDSVIDFINETHAISSSGMPGKVYLTAVPSYCFNATAYAIPFDSYTQDRGVYIHPEGSEWFPSDISTINHEIGHLQPHGARDEFIAQLNMLEQDLIGFVIYSNQGLGIDRTYGKYASHYDPYDRQSLDILSDFIAQANDGEVIADDPSTYDHIVRFVGEDKPITVSILLGLIKFDGDFGKLRKEMGSLIDTGFLDVGINELIQEALLKYSSLGSDEHTLQAYTADITTNVIIAYLKELYRKFGFDTAVEFFYEDLYQTYGSDMGFVDYRSNPKLSTLNCRRIDYVLGDNTTCKSEDACPTGAQYKASFSGTYCCVGLNLGNSNDLSYDKFTVKGNGNHYKAYPNDVLVLHDGTKEVQDSYLVVFDTTNITKIGINELCQ